MPCQLENHESHGDQDSAFQETNPASAGAFAVEKGFALVEIAAGRGERVACIHRICPPMH
jgi:hypothetical protein